MANTVTSTGSFGAFILNPLLPPGMTIRGLEMDSVFVEASQANDNARRVLLTSGGTILLTNSVRNGTLTFRVARFSNTLAGSIAPAFGAAPGQQIPAPSLNYGNTIYSGDLVLYCGLLQQLNQSTGSIISIYYDINGATEVVTFTGCGLRKCDPLKLSGTTVQIYEISFDYDGFIRS